MRRRWLDVDRRHGTIVLAVLWRVGLGIVELWNFELVNAVEKHRWLWDFYDLALCNLMHFLQFTDLSSRSGVLAGFCE